MTEEGMNERRIENFVMRIYLETVQNVVGPNGLKSILNYSHLEKYIDFFPPNNDEMEISLKELQALFSSLYDLFGSKGVRGLQLRVGRENARVGIEKRSAIAKPLKAAARLVPQTMKMRLSLEKIVEQSNQVYTWQQNGPAVQLREEEDCFLIVHEDRFESEGIVSNTPVCNVFVGNIQYVIEWITGRRYRIEEIECRAMGYPADVFRIMKAYEEEHL
jgi:predicted hydrocarbon binding protein